MSCRPHPVRRTPEITIGDLAGLRIVVSPAPRMLLERATAGIEREVAVEAEGSRVARTRDQIRLSLGST
jgi:hypothetical protein